MQKLCSKCKATKPSEEFSKCRTAKDGLQGWCKPCHRAGVLAAQKRNRARRLVEQKRYRDKHPERCKASDARWRAKDPERARKLDAEKVARWRKRNPEILREQVAARRRAKNATPKWGDKAKIRLVYRKARELGMEVDHIVPLNNKLVCGLHVWHNLQLLQRHDNRSKNNRTWPDMP